ncbi:PLAC8 family-domain-containing protein [Chaetomium tenue]|uniref:PLAC8 family-domain-containing protein n=1 Tax=Chaetomium tenue TaxID=1854479 RepID=A0ACB7NWR5_9PEZI|nr:PLAC8 family-domain-containing protein [Chaetomium globosum]
MAAPQQQQPAAAGPINNDDIADWTARLNDVLARPGEYVNSKSPATAQPWYNSFFGCFAPVDTCLMSWCCPCVVFGRTHHRMRKGANLEGYEPINTSCLLFCASSCVALWWVPMAMQRADMRTKYNLEGNCIFDMVTACCCNCCQLAQADKEAAHREPLLVQQGYQAQAGMAFPGAKQ